MTFGHPSALPAFEADEFVVVVETPSGSWQKHDYDQATGLYRWGLELPEVLRFPLSFGFMPGTRAAVGDPLDVVLLLDGSVPTGTVGTARPVGVLKACRTEGGETTRGPPRRGASAPRSSTGWRGAYFSGTSEVAFPAQGVTFAIDGVVAER